MVDASQVIQIILAIIGLASVLLQMIPELDKKNKFKPVLQFIGRFIALNKPLIESIGKTGKGK